MKKNILGALVIFVVTIAIMLMIDDISSHKRAQLGESVENVDPINTPNIATTDLEE